jgi:hypothetical protein
VIIVQSVIGWSFTLSAYPFETLSHSVQRKEDDMAPDSLDPPRTPSRAASSSLALSAVIPWKTLILLSRETAKA